MERQISRLYYDFLELLNLIPLQCLQKDVMLNENVAYGAFQVTIMMVLSNLIQSHRFIQQIDFYITCLFVFLSRLSLSKQYS